jgi:antitoxin (DNA-binding transcriptional repressor) of toxin-antitoxin stability system
VAGTIIDRFPRRPYTYHQIEVERGETILITRDGVPIGRLAPERLTSAERFKAALRDSLADDGFADDHRRGSQDPCPADAKAEFSQLAGVRSEVIAIP